MPGSISTHEREGVTIVELDGPLVAGPPSDGLREHIRALLAAGRNRVVLDLAKVGRIDSTGLGALVVSFTTLRKGAGKLALLHLNRQQLELLVLTKLSTVFEIFDEEQDAVNSFFPGRRIRHFDILRFVEEQRAETSPFLPEGGGRRK